MFKKTLLASVVAMNSQFAVAQDVDIIESLKNEANSIVSEYIEIETQAITDAQISSFNAFDDVTAVNRSNYNRVASFKNENLRIRFASIYIRIYERAIKSSNRLVNRIEGFSPRLRDRIKGMSFYKKLLKRVSFYETEVAKYKSLLNVKQEQSRDVQVVEKTDVVKANPVLVDTSITNETIIEDSMKNTYEVVLSTYETTVTTTVKQVTTTTISYSDNTEKVEVSENTLSETSEVERSTSTKRNLIASIPVESEEKIVADTIRTDEFYGNYALEMIGADVAYEQGYTGSGVTVGVVDSGLTDTNGKFANIVDTYNMNDGSSVVTDTQGHGTHVAGIIGANKTNNTMHGVAYNADLIIVKALNDNGGATHQTLAKAIVWSANAGAKVTNVSIAGNLAYNMAGKGDAGFKYFYNDIEPLKGKDSVVVVAAGNSRLDCNVKISTYSKWEGDEYVNCAFPAALPFVTQFNDLEDSWIAVGAVDSTGNLARYSNKAGIMKDWYMVAPGSDVLSTSADGGYEKMSGTSMAAPVVTGAFALLAEKFPHLTGTQIRAILFQTTDDLGAEGVDEVYGHGLLNVGRAMAPVGDLTLPNGATVEGSGTKVDSVVVVASAGMASALASSASVGQIGILDSYDRVYQIDATSAIYDTSSAFSFDNYVTGETSNIIYGLNQIRNDIHADAVIGYQITETMRLMYGSEKGAFGSVDSSLIGFGADRTDYIRLGYNTDTLAVNLDYGYAKGGTGVGIIESTSDMHGVGFSATKTLEFDNASHTIGLSSPIKIVQGRAEVETLTSRNIDGTLNYSTESVDLSNSEREYTLTNSFTQRVGSSTTVQLNHALVSGSSYTYNTASVSINYLF